MRVSWALPLALSLLLNGCVSLCDGTQLLARAREGDLTALEAVGELGSPRVPPSFNWRGTPDMAKGFDALIPHLDDEDPFVRLVALEGLRKLAERAPSLQRDRYPDLFDRSLGDSEPQVRWRAAWALGRIARSRPALRQALRDPVPRVAERAAWALGQAHDEEAVPDLLEALGREEPEVQAQVHRSLVRISGEQDRSADGWRDWWAGKKGG